MPPVTVSTVAVEQKDLAVRLRATGMVSPINSVDIKAQTNSIIAKVHVRDGQFVKNGDLLFTLDARTEEANIVKAQAQLDKDAASLADAQRQLKRTQELAAQNFIAQGQVDTAMANTQVWTATVSADKAAIDAARVAQSYARILAPQSGRIGTVNVSNGATVQANVSNLLTITQVNPIAVTFTLPQRNITDALAALKAGGAPVTATLADNGGIFKGKLQFVDSQIDVASGSVKAKAYFKNDEEKLWPGAFVEVQQTLREIKDALVIPQAAVIYSARGPFVYAVENGNAVARPLKIVQAQGAEIAVTGVVLGEPLCVALGVAAAPVPVAVTVVLGVDKGVLGGDGDALSDGVADAVTLGDAPRESDELGVPVPVGVGEPVFELVGVGDIVPDGVALGDGVAVSGALGDVDGLAPNELEGEGVGEREGVSDAVLEDVGVGELVSLVVPLPVGVLLGVGAAL